jgi:predicted XRE-type DNA-binding protein
MSEEPLVEKSSGNVFADLGLSNPEERLAKAMLSHLIDLAIEEQGLTQAQAAKVLGTTQPKVSDVVRGNVGSFTMDRLFRYLTMLHMNVRISVSRAGADEQGELLVEVR